MLKIFWMSLLVLILAAGVEATVAPFMIDLLFDI